MAMHKVQYAVHCPIPGQLVHATTLLSLAPPDSNSRKAIQHALETAWDFDEPSRSIISPDLLQVIIAEGVNKLMVTLVPIANPESYRGLAYMAVLFDGTTTTWMAREAAGSYLVEEYVFLQNGELRYFRPDQPGV